MALVSRGIGKPDFSNIGQQIEFEPTAQMPWYYTLAGTLEPGWNELHYLYQVPTNKTLIMSYVTGSFSIDGIYKLQFTVDGVGRYIIQGGHVSQFLGNPGWVFDEGAWMGCNLYNPHSVPVEFYGTPVGFLYDINAG